MEALKIVGFCVLAALVYGVVHDQVTARVCVEYFTIGHPEIVSTRSPALLGLFWGVLGTWWVGLLLGALLALAARSGTGPKRSVGSLARPVALLLACMGGVALAAGLAGFALAGAGRVVLVGPLASSVPAERQVVFLAAAWAHIASYLTALGGGVALVCRVWRARRARAAAPGPATTQRVRVR